jgi:putative phosphoesterase
MLIGLIADTHGFMDPRVPPALAGVDLILHAGDVGSTEVLVALGEIAEVRAVAGNNDAHLEALGMPTHVYLSVGGTNVHVVHRLVDSAPREETDVVVYGHSHKALVYEQDGRLYVNPGAAGRVGFHREVTVGLLRVERGSRRAEIVRLGARLPRQPTRVARRG